MEEKKMGTNEVLNVSFAVVVTPEDIDDIMCAALEGGITYWCNRAKWLQVGSITRSMAETDH